MRVEPHHDAARVRVFRRDVSTVGAVGNDPGKMGFGRERDISPDGHPAPFDLPRRAFQRCDVRVVEPGRCDARYRLLRRDGATVGQPGQPKDPLEGTHRAGFLSQVDQIGELYTEWELRPTVDCVVSRDGHRGEVVSAPCGAYFGPGLEGFRHIRDVLVRYVR
jgi:hypothetical protein